MYFDLVFDIPANRAFTYRAGGNEAAGGNIVAVGKRAMVPFGKRGRDSLGYIVGERDTLPQGVSESSVKTIRRVVDSEPLFGERDIDLARWLSAYYLCGFGQALATMIPSGKKWFPLLHWAMTSMILPTRLRNFQKNRKRHCGK